MTEYHEPTREELAALNDLTPVTLGKAEIQLLLDLSGSVNDPAAPGSTVRKIDVMLGALPTIVETLAPEDAQAEREHAEAMAAGTDPTEKGGVYTIGFSDRIFDFEDLNSDNLAEKEREIRRSIGGGTFIVNGYNALMAHFVEEFGEMPVQDQPAPVTVVLTDGEAGDGVKFGELLAKQTGRTRTVVGIIGHGNAHDATIKQYQQIAADNKCVRVLSFDSVTNSAVVARTALAMIGK
jgi:hypothetical protein